MSRHNIYNYLTMAGGALAAKPRLPLWPRHGAKAEGG